MYEFNNERANSSYGSQVIFRTMKFLSHSGLINCISSDLQGQNLSLKTGCNQDLIFLISWIGQGRMTIGFTIHYLTKHITPFHLPTPTRKRPTFCPYPHQSSPQFIFHLINSGHSISSDCSIIPTSCFPHTHLLMN